VSNLIFPVQGDYKITSFFGPRQAPTLGASSVHKGIDISVPVGTDVFSAISGKVTYAGYSKDRGYNITVTGDNGISTIYQHLSGFVAKVGQMVKPGQKIASSGNTGTSTGPHLHYEVLQDGKAVDPLTFYGAMPGTGSLSSIQDVTAPALDLLKEYWWAAAIGLVILAITK